MKTTLQHTAIVLCVSVLSAVPLAAEFNVSDYGAKGDGKTVCTEALQKTIDACAKVGGGTVVFSPGTYLTGSIFLKDRVDLRIDEQVLIKGVQDESASDVYIGAGIETYGRALINAHHVSPKIYGKGTIDGSARCGGTNTGRCGGL